MTTKAETTNLRLLRLISAALPFASDDETLPLLCGVRIEAGNGAITATASDRYALGHTRQPAYGTLPPFVLASSSAKALTRTLRRSVKAGFRKDPVDITITDDRGGRWITFTLGDTALSFREVDGADKFPDLAGVAAQAGSKEPEGPIGLSFNVLARLHAAMDAIGDLDDLGCSNARWRQGGPATPIRVEVEDWFLAALMPTRVGGKESTVPFGIAEGGEPR